MTAHFDKNSPSSECQPDSIIQRTSRKTESRKSKTSKSRRSQRIKDGKNSK